MTMTDPLGDMLTRIRNGQRVGKSTVICPASQQRANVLDALQREGYIRGFSWSEVDKGIKEITIELKYSNGDPCDPGNFPGLEAWPARVFQDQGSCARI